MSGKPAPSRKEAETENDRARRRAEKQKRVGEHRQAILQRFNQTQRVKQQKKEIDLICPIEYQNTLPALPLDPKLVIYPFDDDFLTAFDAANGVSSDAAVPFELHSQPHLGLAINLVDPEACEAPPAGARPPLDPLDAEITSDAYAKPAAHRKDAAAAAAAAGAGGAVDEGAAVEWLVHSQLMHLDLFDSVYKHADVGATAAASLVSKRAALDAAFRGSRAERIAASFAAAAQADAASLRHPARPHLRAKAVWEVLPDAARSAIPYAQVSFDANPDDTAEAAEAAAAAAAAPPAAAAAALAGRKRRMASAVLRPSAAQAGVNLAEGTVVVNYLLPPPGAAAAAEAAPGDGAAEPPPLLPVRDYHMAVERVDAARGDEHYALFWDDASAAVLLAPIRTRATLTSLKMHGGVAAAAVAAGDGVAPATLVRRRPLTAEEEALVQRARAGLEALAPPRTAAAAAAAAAPSGGRGGRVTGAPAPSLYDRHRASGEPVDFEPRLDEAEISD